MKHNMLLSSQTYKKTMNIVFSLTPKKSFSVIFQCELSLYLMSKQLKR